LLYPPHLIAIAAIYLALLFHKSTRQIVLSAPGKQFPISRYASINYDGISGRRSSRHSSGGSENSKRTEDPISFLAGLNVSISHVTTVIQEFINLYTLWSRFKEEATPDSAHQFSGARKKDKGKGRGRMPNAEIDEEITTSTMRQLVIQMREQKEVDISHPPSTGKAVAINKMLERAQAAG
jgi:cyclin C